MSKTLLILSLISIIALSACQSENDTVVDVVGASPIQITTESGSVTPTQNRVVITLRDGGQRIGDAQAIKVKAVDYLAEGEPVVWEGEATRYSAFELPYWVVYPEFTHDGAWLLELDITTAEGDTVNGTLGVNVLAEPIGLVAGDMAVASQSRTSDDAAQDDLSDITTAEDPNPAYYELSIAEALQTDKPSLIAFTTPGLCQTDTCAPSMQTFDQLWGDYGDKVNFIHIEAYQSFEEPLTYVETMREWGLVNEPWFYLVGADGEITARYDSVLALDEIMPTLDDLLSAS